MRVGGGNSDRPRGLSYGYTVRRVIHSIVLLGGVSVFSFLFADLAPGDFFTEMRLDPLVPAGTAEALRVRHGLDRPLPVRYAAWLGSMGRGEFGYSLAYKSAVGPLLRQRIPGTLLLTASATFLAWLMAVPLGIWNAANRGDVERLDRKGGAIEFYFRFRISCWR